MEKWSDGVVSLKLDVFPDRAAAVALGDVAMNRISRGNGLRSNAFQVERELPKHTARDYVVPDGVLPNS
jgi:hypothetical protein